MEKPEIQEIIRNPDGTFPKGVSGNPAGRPKGKTLKEYQAEKFRFMTDEEREEFLKDVAKEVRWKMAEGMPKQDTDITSGGEKITPIYGGLSRHNSDQEDIQTQKED